MATLALVMGALAISPVASATTYGVTVNSNPSYSLGQNIKVNGTVSPAPGPDTGTFVVVMNPAGRIVLLGEANVNASTGFWSFSAVAGGTTYWTAGTYTVNATWGANGTPIFNTATFTYSTTPVPEFPSSVLPLLLFAGVAVAMILARLAAKQNLRLGF